ncbi:MAG: chorismate synthase [Clostridia bacterium]|nr:chorismate synthase [Clostridia bacterium]
MFDGNALKLMLFGTSHGECVGVCIEGLPDGLKLDMEKIEEFSRRRKGIEGLVTARKEPDKVEFLSGVMEGITTGGALCAVITNKDMRSKDYTPSIPRPSHADYVAHGKYNGHNDYRGGGMFSGRLTAPLVFAGALCDSILEEHGAITGTHILSIHNVCDERLDMVHTDKALLERLNKADIPVLIKEKADEMKEAVRRAKADGDSVGGVLECAAVNVPQFLGGSYFNRLNAKIASLVFSIPAFCGLEIGAGFEAAKRLGSENNDELYYEDGSVRTRTNNSGGLNGGITNGMPIVLRCAVKPTPSIYIEQNTIDMEQKKNIEHTVYGRHDPCIALRAGIVLRSMLNIALADSILMNE